MKIQVLGPGCANCAKMEAHAREALALLGDAAASYTVEKITDSDTMADMGLLVTPGLAVDGVLKSSGKVLSPEEIKNLIS